MRLLTKTIQIVLLEFVLMSIVYAYVPEAIELSTYKSNMPPDNCVYRTLANLLPRCLTPPKTYPFTFDGKNTNSYSNDDDDDELNMVLTDTERVYYAIGLSLCQFAASQAAVPPSCSAALKLTIPSSSSGGNTNMKKCLVDLRASPQLWATYSGYYQTVGRLCAEQAPLHQRDRLLRAQARVAAAHEVAAAQLHDAIAQAADDVWTLVHAQAATRIGALVADIGRRLERVHSEIDAVNDSAWELRSAHAGLVDSQRCANHEANALAGQIRNLTENAVNASIAVAAAVTATQSYSYGTVILSLVTTVFKWATRIGSQFHLIVFVVGVMILTQQQQRTLSRTVLISVSYLVFIITFSSGRDKKSSSDNNSGLRTIELWIYLGRVIFTLFVTLGFIGCLLRVISLVSIKLIGGFDVLSFFRTTSARLPEVMPPEAARITVPVIAGQTYNHKLCRIYQTMH